MTYLHTISHEQMQAHRERQRNYFNTTAAFRDEQHATHLGTQRGGGKVFKSHHLVESDNGQIKSYTSVFEYTDGSKETFDGREWVKIPAPKPVAVQEAA